MTTERQNAPIMMGYLFKDRKDNTPVERKRQV